MARNGAFRHEEHGHHAARPVLCIERAQRGESHAVLEKNDLAHGPHLGAAHGHGETMKCSLFQGDA